jgi:hypothetical protein
VGNEKPSDVPWFAPGHADSLTPKARPSSRRDALWTLQKAGRRIDCALVFHGESYGWECQCLVNGELAYGQGFVLRIDAVEEAEAQRHRLTGTGWAATGTSDPPDEEPS